MAACSLQRLPIFLDLTAKPVLFSEAISLPDERNSDYPLRRCPECDSPFGICRYSIDRNTDLERFFNIEAVTGVISTAKPLDREMNAVHNITILAIESCESHTFLIFFSFFTLKPNKSTAEYKEATIDANVLLVCFSSSLLFDSVHN